ncbi:hypothetical protein RBY4I_2801 [Rhodobacterales bacterium Y4I]|nr:hypothetical protein RBY4I_2801 [Rhodobacterales bacterium Y4I]
MAEIEDFHVESSLFLHRNCLYTSVRTAAMSQIMQSAGGILSQKLLK